jgi:hypothetical protein
LKNPGKPFRTRKKNGSGSRREEFADDFDAIVDRPKLYCGDPRGLKPDTFIEHQRNRTEWDSMVRHYRSIQKNGGPLSAIVGQPHIAEILTGEPANRCDPIEAHDPLDSLP